MTQALTFILIVNFLSIIFLFKTPNIWFKTLWLPATFMQLVLTFKFEFLFLILIVLWLFNFIYYLYELKQVIKK